MSTAIDSGVTLDTLDTQTLDSKFLANRHLLQSGISLSAEQQQQLEEVSLSLKAEGAQDLSRQHKHFLGDMLSHEGRERFIIAPEPFLIAQKRLSVLRRLHDLKQADFSEVLTTSSPSLSQSSYQSPEGPTNCAPLSPIGPLSTPRLSSGSSRHPPSTVRISSNEEEDCAQHTSYTPADIVRTGSHLHESSQAISVELQQSGQINLRKRRQRASQYDLRSRTLEATASTTANNTYEVLDTPHKDPQNAQHVTRRPSQAAHQHFAETTGSNGGTAPLSTTDVPTSLQQLQTHESDIRPSRSQDGLRHVIARSSSSKPASSRIYDWITDESRALHRILELLFGWLWWIAKRPVLVALGVLIILQFLALGYTFVSQAYLNSFCTKHLPYIRHWMCSEWDQMQIDRPIAANKTPIEPVILMHGENIPWELPLYMTMWETSFRDIRINIEGSELQESDKIFFRENANAYLNLSEVTIENVQTLFNHMTITARRAVIDTEVMLQDLEVFGRGQGLPSGPPEPSDDLLTIGMGWLADHRLVYLPVGVEPFREFRYSYDPQLYAISLMQEHTNSILDRLMEELIMTTEVKGQLGLLDDTADGSRERMMVRYNEEKKAKIVRGDQFWRWVVTKYWGTSIDRYASDQRMALLESMGPVYRNASEYLVFKVKALNNIRHACETVHERLRLERYDVLRGKGVSIWLAERVRVLQEGKKVLEEELKG